MACMSCILALDKAGNAHIEGFEANLSQEISIFRI